MKRWYLILFLLFLVGCTNTIIPDDSAAQLKECQISLIQLQKENEELQEQLDEYSFSELTSEIDLSDWDRFEIVDALSNLNPKFKGGSWYNYEYNDDGSYYYKTSAIFPVDPFHSLKYRIFDQEYDKFKLRIFNLAFSGNYVIDTYQEYIDLITRKDTADASITCSKRTSCRDLEIIKCESQDSTYYSWFEGTHLFVSRENGEEALNTFENFYCFNE